MRQFILAKGYGSNDYNVAFYAADFSEEPLGTSVDAEKIKDKGEVNLILKRPVEDGGNVVIPFFNKNLSYSVMKYASSDNKNIKFKCSLTIKNADKIGDYSIIIAKKGMLFNERNKWTAMEFNKDIETAPADIAKALVKRINFNTIGHGIVASVEGAKITLEAEKVGQDYSVIGADLLTGVEVTYEASGSKAYGTAEYVQDLAEKAAADAGFEYTFKEANGYLYPNYPLNPLAVKDSEDTGFDIYTIRFAEPRQTKTTDEVVNQIVQIAVPSATSMTDFTDILDALK